jgi:hypothetical protein
MIQQIHEPRDDSSDENFLNSVVGDFREVKQNPASVNKNLLVVVLDNCGQGGKKLSDCRTSKWTGLPITQVVQSVSELSQQFNLIMK